MSDYVAKRTFLEGLVCPTRGWRLHRAPRESPGPGLEWRFHQGQEVGRLARAQLGTAGVTFERSFEWAGCIARADAIRPHGEGWDLIEVKSGKTPEDGEVKPEYLDDIAYTAMVAQGAGLDVRRCFLMLVRRDYRLGDGGSVLQEVEVTASALGRAREFAAHAGTLVPALLGPEAPTPVLILACRDCDYFAGSCLGVGVPDPLFVLPRLNQKKFEQLRPFETISRLPEDVSLTEGQERVVRVFRSGLPERDLAELASLDAVAWPAHYLDFEAIMPAIPWFADCPPYETIPFQYSLHVAATIDALPRHVEYLAPLEGDWRRELAERLLSDLGAQGSVITYTGFEKRMLNYLAATFPDLESAFKGVLRRLFDLEKVVNKGYCHPGFMGRTTIKKVLPVMAPGLGYDSLTVQGGEDASGAFGLMRLGRRAGGEAAELRQALLEYCKRDTEAMVAVHQGLEAARRGD